MPLWQPKKDREPQEFRTRPPSEPQTPPSSRPADPLDTFLSHFDTTVSDSPYGSPQKQRQIANVARPFIPPQPGAAPPNLPGTESVPEEAVSDDDVHHVDPENQDEIVRKLADIGCFNLIRIYDNLSAIGGSKAVHEFETLVNMATAPRPSEMMVQHDIAKNVVESSRAGITESDFPDIGGAIGALTEEVFNTLVEKVADHGGSLPPIGITTAPQAYYMGRVVKFRGVSPNIDVYKDFVSEVERRRKENPQSPVMEIEDAIIARDPLKYTVIKRIRERAIPAFTTYEKSNLGKKSKEIYSQLVGELITNKYHCIEIRFDVSDFIDESRVRHLNVNELPLARALLFMESDPRTTKKKSANPEIKSQIISPKDTLGRMPISFITSVEIETPNGEKINYGLPNIEYPKSESTCHILTYKANKKSKILLVESFELVYSLLRSLDVDEILQYLD